MTYFKTKLDGNHKQVCQYLEAHGCEVWQCLKPLDLYVWRKGETAFVEVKMPGSQAKWTRTQLLFIGSTKFNVLIATSPEDALYKLRDRQYLKHKDKDYISTMLAFDSREYFTPREIGWSL